MESFLLKEPKKQKDLVLRIWIVLMLFVCHMSAVSVGEYLLMGNPRGHLALYYQDMTSKRSNFADLNAAIGYDSPISKDGFGFGGSFWVAGRMYENQRGDFNSTKQDFVWTEGYLRYDNNERLRIEAGRFYANTEWIKYYNQGARLDFMVAPNIFLNLMWVNKNAYVTNYRMSNYRNPFDTAGVFYGSITLALAEAPIKLTPYFYVAPNYFNAFGIKANLDKELAGGSVFYTNLHLLSYMGKNQVIEQSRTDGDGGFFWFESGIKWSGVKFGGGVIIVSKRGTSGIDVFGQSTAFERREGLFYANANTFYGVLEYTFKNHIILESAVRYTGIDSKQVFNWEANARFALAQNVYIGGGLIGMLNDANISLDDYIFASDGRNYLLGRVFLQFNY